MPRDNIPYTVLNFEDIIAAGEAKDSELHAEESKRTQENLRGGNAGCVVEGEVYGGCHRQSIARALGYSVPPDFSSRRFFDAGIGNEEVFGGYLDKGWTGKLLREEGIPVEWELPSGRKVTGRPDFVLCTPDGQPVLGNEFKTLSSEGATNGKWFDRKPGAEHLCQAGHYMWQLAIPWVLTYSNNTRHSVNWFAKKKHGLTGFPSIEPFRMHFYLTIKDGTLYYRDGVAGSDVKTRLTTKGFYEYYQLVDECLATKSLYLLPASKYATGEDMPWQHERYCEMCQAAARAQGDWDRWIDELEVICNV